MGMFDWYQPTGRLRCPVDGHLLVTWQGKDGPCAFFLWREGVAHPVDQLADEEVRLSAAQREQWTLPARFIIYSYDCPAHHPVEAICTTHNSIWSSTKIR
jgi:hypothetical protein